MHFKMTLNAKKINGKGSKGNTSGKKNTLETKRKRRPAKKDKRKYKPFGKRALTAAKSLKKRQPTLAPTVHGRTVKQRCMKANWPGLMKEEWAPGKKQLHGRITQTM